MENLLLIGFMGSGKSTLGRKLASAMELPFLDTDYRIEEKQSMDISGLFETKGEEYFRELETSCLKELLQEEQRRVISTGGGMVIRQENRELLKQLGTTVFLKVSPQTVYDRLKGDGTRPLLRGESPLQSIEVLLRERSGYYEEAACIVIEADGKSIEALTEEIQRRIETQKTERKEG